LQNPHGDDPQIWVVGSRERVATDRSQFSPMIPAPLAPGKYMTLLMR
jgi:hypothetical protein